MNQSAFYRLVMAVAAAALVSCSSGSRTPKPAPIDPCPNSPDIVRTEFDPKEGTVPLKVVFNVTAEDADEAFSAACPGGLTYHFDFDGDGIEDLRSQKGKGISYVYKTPGNYRLKIWVTDAQRHHSKPVYKFVKAAPNAPPVIASFDVYPNTGQLENGVFSPSFDWAAYDPDGPPLAQIQVFFGDGTNQILDGSQTGTMHLYTQPGNFTVRLVVTDNMGAVAERTLTVFVVRKIFSSSLIQTAGESLAIKFNDNGGAHWSGPDGLYDWAYVADGPIALKVLRYPLSAFDPGQAGSNVQLTALADPNPNAGDNWDSVAVYGHMAVIGGNYGLQIFDVNTEPSFACSATAATASNCFPGTPTSPISFCDANGNTTLLGASFNRIQLVSPSGTGQTWVAGTVPFANSNLGGLFAVELDNLNIASGSGYNAGGRCWSHATYGGTYGNGNLLQSDTSGFAVRGDYAFIGFPNEGFHIVDLGAYLSPPYDRSTIRQVYNMLYDSALPGGNSIAHGFAFAEPVPVSAMLIPADFAAISTTSVLLDNNFDNAYSSDVNCDEYTVIDSMNSSAGATMATLGTARAILPGNRVAIGFSNGTADNNGGLGYQVIANGATGQTLVQPLPPSAPGSWASAYPIPVSYAILPAYPGANPVSISTQQAGLIARNNRCRNFLNAYAPVTAPVSVQFTSAPLAYVSLEGTNVGIVIYDLTHPEAPQPLAHGGDMFLQSDRMIVHDGHLYMAGRGKGSFPILDVSDPLHIQKSYMERLVTAGTFCWQTSASCQLPIKDFKISDLAYRTTPSNPRGALVVAGGAMGVQGLDVAAAVTAATPLGRNACESHFVDSACTQSLPGLQLRHEGTPSDIQLVKGDYALIGLKTGGVLIYDIRALRYGGPATFVTHVRTTGDPSAIRVAYDGSQNPKSLYVADRTSFYRIPFTDPAHPGAYAGSLPTGGGASGFVCAEQTSGRTFLCDSYGGAAREFFAEGDAMPNTQMKFYYPNVDASHAAPHSCAPDISRDYSISPGFLHLATDMLAGRLFVFAETGTALYGNVIRELPLDIAGNVKLTGGMAIGCEWWEQNALGNVLAYQKRTGAVPWKRLYTGDTSGHIYVYSIDAMEAELGDPTQSLVNAPPPLMGGLSLRATAGAANPLITRMVPLGPYLFVAANEAGAFVLDASDPANLVIVGETLVSVSNVLAYTLAANAFPTDPNLPNGDYTYLALVSDNRPAGGVRILRFPGLARP